MKFEVTNLSQAIGEIDLANEEILAAVAVTLYAHCQTIMRVAKRRAPVLTGALASSGHVEPPAVGMTEDGEATVGVTLGFGGPSAVYAHYQHGQGFAPGTDRPRLVTWQSGYTKEFPHKPEGQGYLYYPLMADVPVMVEDISLAISRVKTA